jgi:DNA-binding response OmpR family regulator
VRRKAGLNILVVDRDRDICDMIAEALKNQFKTSVECTQSSAQAIDRIAAAQFDLAIVDPVLQGMSGFALTAVAANENIPVLLLAGHPTWIQELDRFDFPYLGKPFELDALFAKAALVLQDSAENIRLVKASTARMAASAATLQATICESRNLLNESKARRNQRESGRAHLCQG